MLVHHVCAALHRWRIGLGVASLICVTGRAVIYSIPDRYEVTARLYADLDNLLMINLDSPDSSGSLPNRTEILRQALLYKPNLEKMIARTDLNLTSGGSKGHEQLITHIATGIKVALRKRRSCSSSHIAAPIRWPHAMSFRRCWLSLFKPRLVRAARMRNCPGVYLRRRLSQFRMPWSKKCEFRSSTLLKSHACRSHQTER
jgi:hypothetical protein